MDIVDNWTNQINLYVIGVLECITVGWLVSVLVFLSGFFVRLIVNRKKKNGFVETKSSGRMRIREPQIFKAGSRRSD